ncbi:unnamed protein product, partial [Musa hybrid cultivar]
MAARRLPLSLLVLAMVAAFLLISPAQAQICGANLSKLVKECRKYVQIKGPQINPSKTCCAEIKKVDVPCLCKNIPPGIEKTISLKKAVYVAKRCGKPVPKGKCGSKNTFI